MKTGTQEALENQRKHNIAMIPAWCAFMRWQAEMEAKIIEGVLNTIEPEIMDCRAN